MFKEFKEFATKGNIVDMAVGVIIGGSFQKIVTSLVNDIIMPVISIFTGKIDYTEMSVTIGSVSIRYGLFLTSVIDFLLIALSIFLFLKYMNRINRKIEKMTSKELDKINKKIKKKTGKSLKKEPVKEEPKTKICPFCYTEVDIRATKCPHCTSNLDK